MEEFIAQRPKKSVQQLKNIVLAEETNKEVIHQLAIELLQY